MDYINWEDNFDKFPTMEDLNLEQVNTINNNNGIIPDNFSELYPDSVETIHLDNGESHKISKHFLQAFHINWIVSLMKSLNNAFKNIWSSKGEFNPNTLYYKGDLVKYRNESYLCLLNCKGQPPSDTPLVWRKISGEKGDKGDSAISYQLNLPTPYIYKYPDGNYSPNEIAFSSCKNQSNKVAYYPATIKTYQRTSYNSPWISGVSFSNIISNSINIKQTFPNAKEIKFDMIIGNVIVDSKVISVIDLSTFKGVIKDINDIFITPIHCESMSNSPLKEITLPIDFHKDEPIKPFIIRFVNGNTLNSGNKIYLSINQDSTSSFQIIDNKGNPYLLNNEIDKDELYLINYDCKEYKYIVSAKVNLNGVASNNELGLVYCDNTTSLRISNGHMYHSNSNGHYHIPANGNNNQILIYGDSPGTAKWADLKNIINDNLSNINNSFPQGFTGRSTKKFGEQSGTAITRWDYDNGTSTPASIAFYINETYSDRLDVQLDGYFYQNEGKKRCLDTSDIEIEYLDENKTNNNIKIKIGSSNYINSNIENGVIKMIYD